MTSMKTNIPLIDLSKCGLLVEDDSKVDSDTFANIGKQLYDALSTTGFVYLSNHGIPMKKVDDMNEIAAKFFALPDDEKRKLYAHVMTFAYEPLFTVKADMKHTDHFEGFRITGEAFDRNDTPWPNIPRFRENCFDLTQDFKLLFWRLLKALGVGMNLKNPEYFFKAHSLVNRTGNMSALKLVQYPPVPNDDVLSEHRMRLGEHADWVTLIFLFQDDIGGLQVKNENGEFIDVHPIPGTIVLDVGDTLDKWSGGRLKSTVHRVVPPEDPEKRKRIRRSIVYFGNANQDVLLEPLQFEDGVENEEKSNEKPLTVEEYMAKRFDEVYH